MGSRLLNRDEEQTRTFHIATIGISLISKTASPTVFLAREGSSLKHAEEFVRLVSKHLEEVGDVVMKIIICLDRHRISVKENRPGTSEWLDILPTPWEVCIDKLERVRFAPVICEWNDPAHVSTVDSWRYCTVAAAIPKIEQASSNS